MWILKGKTMIRASLRGYIAAALCLILFVGIAQIQGGSVSQDETASPNNSQDELVRQKKRVEIRKRAVRRKWGKLKVGMGESEVRKILGRPKLRQGGSDACVWFYQDLPVSIADQNILGLAGMVLFEAKSLEFLIDEASAVYKEVISDAEIKRNGAIDRADERHERDVEQEKKKYDDYSKQLQREDLKDQKRREGFLRWRWPWWRRSRERRAERALKKFDAESAREDNIRRHRDTRGAKKRQAERIFESDLEIANERRGRRIKRLMSEPRSPEFQLKSFNEPNWDECEDLLVKDKEPLPKKKPKEPWMMRVAWKRLKINMKASQAYGILGEPVKMETEGDESIAQYGDTAGSGELYLVSQSDGVERLDSWVEPFWPDVL
jgi:hypothetical protein